MSQQYVPDEKEQTPEAEALSEVERLEQELEDYKSRYLEQKVKSEELEWKLDAAKEAYKEVTTCTSWRLTIPLRGLADSLKTVCHVMKHFFSELRIHGLRYMLTRSREIRLAREQMQEGQFGRYAKRVLKMQAGEKFPLDLRFSILVPLYNTPENYLKEMISSVQAQTYPNWELCLADGSDEAHDYVGRVCTGLAQKDNRIRYQKLEHNGGISENTNACLRMATGDYIGLLDHDDCLCPAALYEAMKAICEKDADLIYTDEAVFTTNIRKPASQHFKPDFAPDYLSCVNYICHFTVFSQALLDLVGSFRSECDGAQDFDLILRLTEQAKNVVHIPKVLYFWRSHEGSTAQDVAEKPYVTAGGHRAVEAHLERIGMPGKVTDGAAPSVYRISYRIKGNPLVSILIPSYEHVADLRKCLNSIYQKSTYSNFEVIVIENNSRDPETFRFYEKAKKTYKNLRVIVWEQEFNYSAINNFGAQYAGGEYLLLLNNDTEVISADWIQEMLMYAQRSDVGAVGAKLYYPDSTIQHAGVGVGLGGVAGHFHREASRLFGGYMYRLISVQNVSAVTAACALFPRHVWDEINGLDESFQVAYNDVDICLRIREKGYLVVWTPYAQLRHFESKSRGQDTLPENQARFAREKEHFQKRWATVLAAGDPYFNPNFSYRYDDFRTKQLEEYL